MSKFHNISPKGIGYILFRFLKKVNAIDTTLLQVYKGNERVIQQRLETAVGLQPELRSENMGRILRFGHCFSRNWKRQLIAGVLLRVS